MEAINQTTEYRNRLVRKLVWNDRDPVQVAAFLEKAELEGNEETKSDIRAYLNHLENLAGGVLEGILDFSTLARMSGGQILSAATNYRPYIERRRAELKSSDVYTDIEKLAERLRAHYELT